MSRPTVCLSFDWDGVSVWMAGGATDARSLSRGEFGPRVGIPRLLELCRRLEVRATFFTPGHTADTYPETAEQIAAAGSGSAQGFTIAIRAARLALMRVFRRFFLPYQPTAA